MYREDDLKRIESIHKKLSSIYEIIKRHGSITNSLADDIEAQPAILMLLIASAEQFNKLKKNDSTILNSFDEIDIKGIISVRNFIAHDYDGINLSIIEDSLRHGIPEILEVCSKLLSKNINKYND